MDITIYYHQISMSDETIEATFILLDNLLGEYRVMTQLGSIEFAEANQLTQYIYPFDDLVKVINDN